MISRRVNWHYLLSFVLYLKELLSLICSPSFDTQIKNGVKRQMKFRFVLCLSLCAYVLKEEKVAKFYFCTKQCIEYDTLNMWFLDILWFIGFFKEEKGIHEIFIQCNFHYFRFRLAIEEKVTMMIDLTNYRMIVHA